MVGSIVTEVSTPANTNEVLTELRNKMEEVMPDSEPWLTTPHDMLGGRTPLEVASASEQGKEIVFNLIGLIKSGAFT
ncbi:MAG: antitoxin Xre/MbcA/ParS toxin-binding domain-containing protein [Blastocatellia bacterium]